MARFAAPLTRTLSTTQTLGTIGQGSTTKRISIIDAVLGVDGTPGDTAVRATFQRCSALGTSTAVTPRPLDEADAASLAVAGQAHSAEPTYTANKELLQLVFNQRSTVRWFAAPGEELIVPTTAAAGIGIQTPVAPALSGYASVIFDQ
jgi:hypothetical protein